jgi:hypothetical protein
MFALCLLALSQEARAEWPLSVAAAGLHTLPADWEPAGSICRLALKLLRRGYAFNRSECRTAFQPRSRIMLYMTESGPTARFLETKTTTRDKHAPPARVVAEAAPK